MGSRPTRYALNKTKYLLDPELVSLESLLDRNWETSPRDVLLLMTALNTGARAQEILNLRTDDLNPHDHTVFVRGLKNSNDRELPLRGPLFLKLLSHAKVQQKSGASESRPSKQPLLFPIGYHRLRQIWDLYRPADKKFHCLRHTFAIRLYKKTKDIRLVQFALGHRNIANTMIYADYAYSQEELRKLII